MARKFVGNAILEGKVGSLVNTAAVQRDWTKLEKRAEKNLKKVSKGNCRGVHLEWNNLMQQNRPGTDCYVH